MTTLTIAEANAMVPQNVLRIIKEKDLKSAHVARAAGYSRQQMSDMLHGRKLIRPVDVVALTDALDVGADELFCAQK